MNPSEQKTKEETIDGIMKKHSQILSDGHYRTYPGGLVKAMDEYATQQVTAALAEKPDNYWKKRALAAEVVVNKFGWHPDQPWRVEKLSGYDEAVEYWLKLKADKSTSSTKEGEKEAWISVEDRLPEGEEDILYFHNGYIELGHYSLTARQFCYDNYETEHYASIVTHWRPLPAPPVGFLKI